MKRIFLLLLLIIGGFTFCFGQYAMDDLNIFHLYKKGENSPSVPQNAADSSKLFSYRAAQRESQSQTHNNLIDSSTFHYSFSNGTSTKSVTELTSGLSSITYTVTTQKPFTKSQVNMRVDSTALFSKRDAIKKDSLVTYVFVIPGIDTTSISKIRIKIGFEEGGTELFDHLFSYDSFSGLPSGCSYKREKQTVYIEVQTVATNNKRKYFASSSENTNQQIISLNKYNGY